MDSICSNTSLVAPGYLSVCWSWRRACVGAQTGRLAGAAAHQLASSPPGTFGACRWRRRCGRVDELADESASSSWALQWPASRWAGMEMPSGCTPTADGSGRATAKSTSRGGPVPRPAACSPLSTSIHHQLRLLQVVSHHRQHRAPLAFGCHHPRRLRHHRHRPFSSTRCRSSSIEQHSASRIVSS